MGRASCEDVDWVGRLVGFDIGMIVVVMMRDGLWIVHHSHSNSIVDDHYSHQHPHSAMPRRVWRGLVR